MAVKKKPARQEGPDKGKVYSAFLLRFSLGIIFFFSGIQKFIGGYSGFVDTMANIMSKTWLPEVLVRLYAYSLPFAELILGLLLILGLFRMWVLLLTGLMIVSLAFGNILIEDHQNIANILIYLVVCTLALWQNKVDRISLDSKLDV